MIKSRRDEKLSLSNNGIIHFMTEQERAYGLLGEDTTGRKEEGISSELTIRSHHMDFYDLIIRSTAFSSATTFEKICRPIIEDNLSNIIEDSYDLGIGFRNYYGYPINDNSIPFTYAEDIIGRVKSEGNREEYKRKALNRYLRFLTAPDDTPVRIGTLLDDICKDCFFGNGNGGSHCRKLDAWRDGEEEAALFGFKRNVLEFLSETAIADRKKAHPDQYQIRTIQRPVERPLIKRQIRTVRTQDTLQLEMPLGLVRDVLTYSVTKGQRNIFYSYHDLLQRRGISQRAGFPPQ
jgi:hypothetical protein